GIAIQVDESRQGRDLDGDGDRFDYVPMIWTPTQGLVNLGTATEQGSMCGLDGGGLSFLLAPNVIRNPYQEPPENFGTVAVWTPTGGIRSLGIISEETGFPYSGGAMVGLAGGGLAVTASETRQ